MKTSLMRSHGRSLIFTSIGVYSWLVTCGGCAVVFSILADNEATRGQCLLCQGPSTLQHVCRAQALVGTSASKSSIRRFEITEKAPTRAFSWLKPATTAFAFKTLLRHYAKRALTTRSLNVKLGPRRNYHKGRAAIRHYANQTARPL